ncbi:MAG: DUF1697 domain-containing protein [Actinomycetes bacterium]
MATTTYVALLRGINLGRSRQVAMADLRAVVAEIGHGDVRTHLRSGNVLLTADARSSDALVAPLEDALSARFGFDARVVVRSRDELAAVVASDPFAGVATDGARYLVTFLSEPAGHRLDDLDPDAYAPDAFRVRGREIYAWLPDGVTASRLDRTAWEQRLPGVTVTARNWNTVTRLLAMADEPVG